MLASGQIQGGLRTVMLGKVIFGSRKINAFRANTHLTKHCLSITHCMCRFHAVDHTICNTILQKERLQPKRLMDVMCDWHVVGTA